MPTQSSIHYYANWAKERIDEMDATLSSLELKAGEVAAESRAKADQILSDLRSKRDAFSDTIKQQAGVGEDAWSKAKAQLETQWGAFEAEVGSYIEALGKNAEQVQATFKDRAAAQVKAWQEATDQIQQAAVKFSAERRGDIDAAIDSMKANAALAEQTLDKFNKAGTESWSALNAALGETRKAFDGANQAVRDAFAKMK
jgi:ElaB/YqjD/DUF883 family membrane-anchored ribosome-binding protein